MAKEVRYSWEVIHGAVETLAYVAQPLNCTNILAVARGGLIPATMLSHRLVIPMEVVNVFSYRGKEKVAVPQMTQSDDQYARMRSYGPKLLIVDDILDTGDTYDLMMKHFPEAHFACLISKRPILKALHFGYCPKEVWVHFPWELRT